MSDMMWLVPSMMKDQMFCWTGRIPIQQVSTPQHTGAEVDQLQWHQVGATRGTAAFPTGTYHHSGWDDRR